MTFCDLLREVNFKRKKVYYNFKIKENKYNNNDHIITTIFIITITITALFSNKYLFFWFECPQQEFANCKLKLQTIMIWF